MAKTSITQPTASPRLCPTCGTRVGTAATKCLVCGTDLSAVAPGQRPAVRGFSAPRVTISMPALIAVMMILLLAGAGLVYAAFTGMLPTAERNTPTPTATNTLPPTVTPTPTPTETPVPTPTPLPPLDYSIKDGDTCISIALIAKISVNSLLAANPTLNCDFLTVGTTIKVPQPTPTPTPLPTATLPPSVATQPTRPTHTVKSGETLAGIARFYGLNVADIMAVNGITDPNNIREGQILVIPIDLRVTPGPTPTATPPPPWAAPNLLGPADGSSFKAEDTITLQWTSVGELRAGEFYYITLEDVTCGCAKIEQFATLETKLIAPETLRPADAVSHLFRWSVTTVRQRNFGETGNPIYDSAGAASPNRYFIWNSP